MGVGVDVEVGAGVDVSAGVELPGIGACVVQAARTRASGTAAKP
ncbi:MAG: hypothetical protein ABIX44_05720 [Cryobacterium sp.]